VTEILEGPNSNQVAHLRNTGYYWDIWNNTPLGLYSTQKEQQFIQRSIKNRDSKKHILDVAGGVEDSLSLWIDKGMSLQLLRWIRYFYYC